MFKDREYDLRQWLTRFDQPPAAASDFHRRRPSARTLDRLFRLEETRTVGHDWVVRYHNRALQLARQVATPPRGAPSPSVKGQRVGRRREDGLQGTTSFGVIPETAR